MLTTCSAGIPKDKIVAAHGNFDSATCIDTGEDVPVEEVREAIMAGKEGYEALNARYGGLVKPDITFFGEKLPDRFYRLAGFPLPGINCEDNDFDKCDLLIVMGTSLVVQPFASLVDRVPADCPRLLLNRDAVALFNPVMALMGHNSGFRFTDASNYRDACHLGNCDDAVKDLAALLGWNAELDALVTECGGWPAPGPILEQISAKPPKKQISKETAAAMAKVLQGIMGGGATSQTTEAPPDDSGVANLRGEGGVRGGKGECERAAGEGGGERERCDDDSAVAGGGKLTPHLSLSHPPFLQAHLS